MNLVAHDGTLVGTMNQQGQITAVVSREIESPGIFQNAKKAFLRYLDPQVKELPDEVKARILGAFGDKSLRLNQHSIYAVKRYNGKQTLFFESVDKEESGITNINNGKLDENRFFVATAMSFKFARVANGTPEETYNRAKVAVWEDAVQNGELLNSTIFLRIDSKHVLRLTGEVFVTAPDDREATIHFTSPILLPARTALELEVRGPDAPSSLVSDTDFLRVAFYGMFTDAN